jgi:hypothetical protein
MEIISAAFELLRERTPISWIRERDIDLLICSELHANSHLQALFARKCGFQSQEFQGAWVSHVELEGENDLILAYGRESSVYLALVENKIDAPLQPNQGARYTQRARRWEREPNVSLVATILMAPARYQSPTGAQRFDARVDYEEVAQALVASADPRSSFLSRTLRAGIEAAHRGYVAIPDATTTDMWMACWDISTKIAPRLNFDSPGAKPRKSTWFYFRRADGFAGDSWRTAVVVFKAERGQVDLQFGGLTKDQLARLAEGFLTNDMQVVRAAKSASIRIQVNAIDFSADPRTQLKATTEGFSACERLRDFFVTHRVRLVGNRAQ